MKFPVDQEKLEVRNHVTGYWVIVVEPLEQGQHDGSRVVPYEVPCDAQVHRYRQVAARTYTYIHNNTLVQLYTHIQPKLQGTRSNNGQIILKLKRFISKIKTVMC